MAPIFVPVTLTVPPIPLGHAAGVGNVINVAFEQLSLIGCANNDKLKIKNNIDRIFFMSIMYKYEYYRRKVYTVNRVFSKTC